MTMYAPSVGEPTLTFTTDDIDDLRRICATTAADDEIVTQILKAVIRSYSGYNTKMNRPLVQRVVTQYYVDKIPQFWLWTGGEGILESGGYPIVSYWEHGSWVVIDSQHYSINQGPKYYSIQLDQMFYDALDLMPDGFSRRVRIEYITNTNQLADLPEDLRTAFMIETRRRFDQRGGGNRNQGSDYVDWRWLEQNIYQHSRPRNILWYPCE